MDTISIIKPQSFGGKARAIQLRKEALERYYSNPNKCLFCGKILEVPDKVKVGDIRKKKFCNQRCGARYNSIYGKKRTKKIHFENFQGGLRSRPKKGDGGVKRQRKK